MPGRVGDIGLLFGAQGLACFYEMHLWRKRGHLHGAQCIGRQRASARSKLYIERMVLSPATYPNIRQPQANKLRSEEHTSELQSLMRISYAVFCLKKKKKHTHKHIKSIYNRHQYYNDRQRR